MVFWSVSKKWIYIIDQETKSGFLGSGSELFLADRQGEDSLNGSFFCWMMYHALKKTVSDVSFVISANVEVPFDRHSAQSNAESQNLIVILRLVKRIHRNELSFCAKQCGVTKTNCHSARSETESQNRIVVLRSVKRRRRI